MTLSELRAHRAALDWTQAQMADALGLSRRQYQDLEAGKWQVRQTHVLAVERVLFHEAVERKALTLLTPSLLADTRRYAGILAGRR